MFTPRTDVSQFLTGPQDQPLPKQTEPEGVALRDIIDRAADRGPLKKQTLEDPFLLERTEKFRKPGETILQLIARTGMSRDQMMRWPDSTIEAFIAIREHFDREEGIREPQAYRTFDYDLKLNHKEGVK